MAATDGGGGTAKLSTVERVVKSKCRSLYSRQRLVVDL